MTVDFFLETVKTKRKHISSIKRKKLINPESYYLQKYFQK